MSRPVVAPWRQHSALHRLEGLADAPRLDAPRQIDDQAVEGLIALPPGRDAGPRDARRYPVDRQRLG